MSDGKFTQIIELRTTNMPEMARLDAEFLGSLSPEIRKQMFLRGQTIADRNDPEHFFVVLEYESYESMQAAMQLPQSDELSAAVAPLMIGEPTFYDCDVLHRDSND
jgi:quinol monooxygenase YgiN